MGVVMDYLCQILNLVHNHGLVGKGNERLWEGEGKGTKTSAKTYNGLANSHGNNRMATSNQN